MNTTTLLVRQKQLSDTRLHTIDTPALADGQIRVRVDPFALTANNITYAAMGDMLGYWKFYPTGDAEWGVVPVWGFGSYGFAFNRLTIEPARFINELF